MIRVVRHATAYLAARDTRWRVYDLVPHPTGPSTLTAPGAAGAVARWFVRAGDRWTFIAMFEGEDSSDVAPTTLTRQLERALRRMPRAQTSESPADYLKRQRAHIAAHPEYFMPSGRVRDAHPPADPATSPTPIAPRRGAN